MVMLMEMVCFHSKSFKDLQVKLKKAMIQMDQEAEEVEVDQEAEEVEVDQEAEVDLEVEVVQEAEEIEVDQEAEVVQEAEVKKVETTEKDSKMLKDKD